MKIIYIFFIVTFNTPSVSGQILESLPDSLQKILATLPESQHDSIYYRYGKAFYKAATFESFGLALDCYKKTLLLAEKYNNYPLYVDAHQSIGSVYDAKNESTDQMLYYFKKAYDLSDKLHDSTRIFYAICVTHAYSALKDTNQCLKYLNIVKKIGYNLYEKGSEEFDKHNLMVANMGSSILPVNDFIHLFRDVNQERVYKSERLPYNNYYTFCSFKYYSALKNYDKATEILKTHLKTGKDSSVVLRFLCRTYANSGNFKEAYEWSEKYNDYKFRNAKTAQDNELVVKLLKTANEAKEKEKKFKEKQNQYLILGLLFALATIGVSVYFWYFNHKGKIELAKSNHEKTLLIHEVHHRVKNNVQLLYSLAKLQLPNIKDAIARELWLKNLSQLNGMALVNEKLYNTEGVTSFELKEFVPEMLGHFKQFQGESDKTVFNINIADTINVRADFAIPFGLILSELITNSYKHALKNDNPKIDISILKKSEKGIEFSYTDYGQLADTSIILNKKSGGSALIRDLVRQLKGKVLITNDNYLHYNLSLPI